MFARAEIMHFFLTVVTTKCCWNVSSGVSSCGYNVQNLHGDFQERRKYFFLSIFFFFGSSVCQDISKHYKVKNISIL